MELVVVTLVVLYGTPVLLFAGTCIYQGIENWRWWREHR